MSFMAVIVNHKTVIDSDASCLLDDGLYLAVPLTPFICDEINVPALLS